MPEFRPLSQRKLRNRSSNLKKGGTNIVERNLRKTRIGKVVSNKMDKTIVVASRRPCKTSALQKDRKENI